MITKKHRFYGPASIRYVLKKGATIRGATITVRGIKNYKTSSYRAAVVVSKKVTKSAPKRNRIRRRIYEIVRLQAPKYLKNHDIVFLIFKEDVATMPQAKLESHIVANLQEVAQIS